MAEPAASSSLRLSSSPTCSSSAGAPLGQEPGVAVAQPESPLPLMQKRSGVVSFAPSRRLLLSASFAFLRCRLPLPRSLRRVWSRALGAVVVATVLALVSISAHLKLRELPAPGIASAPVFPPVGSCDAAGAAASSPHPDAAFWWLSPTLNRWASARWLHDHLLQVAECGASAAPAAVLSRVVLQRASPPPASAFYSQLIYDPLRALPLLPVTPYGARRIAGNVALRNVRIVNGTVVVHLPPPSLVSRWSPASREQAADSDEYEYDSELQRQGEAFAPYEAARAPWQKPPVALVKGRSWLNSTRWPIPSYCSPLPQEDAAASSPFSSPRCCCRASQWDHPSHSHGRLLFTSDPYAMLERNAHSLQRLHHRLTGAHSNASLFTGLRSVRADKLLLPLRLDFSALDYADSAQCDEVVDNEFVVSALEPGNAWHGAADFAIPFYSLLNDPCFFPLQQETQAGSLATGELEAEAELDGRDELQPATGSGAASLPQSRVCRSSHRPRRDARILQGSPGTMRNVYFPFLTDSRPGDAAAPGSRLPRLSSLSRLQELNLTLCIRDAVIGIPWYFHHEQLVFERVDDLRDEFEQARLQQLLHDIEATISMRTDDDADTDGQQSHPLSSRRVDALVPAAEADALQDEYRRALQEEGLEPHPALPVSRFIRALPPPLWFPVPPSYSEWQTAHPELTAAADSRFTATRAERPRPFNGSEIRALRASIAFHGAEGGGTGRGAAAAATAPPRLRLLYVQRGRGSRTLVQRATMLALAAAAGFEVEIGDFSFLSSFAAWRRHLNWLRSFHVVLGVHGAGLINIIGSLPQRALLVEVFAHCWKYPWYRLTYSGKLARQAQLRGFGIVSPCPTPPPARHRQPTEGELRARVYARRADYASAAEVNASMAALFRYWHDDFITLPQQTEILIDLPIATV